MAFCRVTTPEIPRNFLESPCSGLRLSTVDAATAPRIFSDLRSLTLWFSALQPSSGPKPPCVLPAPPENPILATATFEVPKLVLPSRLVPTLPSFLATLFGRSDRHVNHLSWFLGLSGLPHLPCWPHTVSHLLPGLFPYSLGAHDIARVLLFPAWPTPMLRSLACNVP